MYSFVSGFDTIASAGLQNRGLSLGSAPATPWKETEEVADVTSGSFEHAFEGRGGLHVDTSEIFDTPAAGLLAK